jgi:diguanylate cyclase (GGDEF)-like protein/PAS domain S-box-containing protein
VAVGDTIAIGRDTLARMFAIIQSLGGGDDLDDILNLVAHAVVDVIGFDAVAINVVTPSGDLRVDTVVGPPELLEILGGTLSQAGWLELLDAGEQWGQLRFLREPQLDDDVPHVDPWHERLDGTAAATAPTEGTEPWCPEFALLAPMWRGSRDLLGVISVDLPRSGYTPDVQQRALLELFASQAGAAIARVRAFERATDTTTLYRAAFASSPAPTVVLDAGLRITDVNGAFLDLADAVDGELTGRMLGELVVLAEPDFVAAGLAALASGEAFTVADECELRHPRGEPWRRWVRVEARRIDGVATGVQYIGIVTDRTDIRESMTALRREADHDHLTGLKVRAAGLRELDRLCGQGAVEATCRAVLYCDLDNFKGINDAAGHPAGDRTLTEVARELLRIADAADTVCRWGGDEFVIIVNRPTASDVVELANRLVSSVRALAAAAPESDPVRLLDLSIGIAEIAPASAPAAVLDIADAALYRAKSDPVRRVHIELL